MVSTWKKKKKKKKKKEKKERPRNSYMQEVTTGMREKGINKNGMGRQRRMEKKNKTLGTERCANIDTL